MPLGGDFVKVQIEDLEDDGQREKTDQKPAVGATAAANAAEDEDDEEEFKDAVQGDDGTGGLTEVQLYEEEDDTFADDATACIRSSDQVYFTTTVSKEEGASGPGAHKPSIQEDVLNSVNNLRLNVNNRLIGKMRKLSITELNRRTRSSKHAKLYRLAFYVAITSLSFLFLYLIYQNLFSSEG